MYVINKINPTAPITYSLIDMNDEPIEGTWYTWEIQKVQKPSVFKVEKVLDKRKVNNKWRYFVKFQGYDETFNDWVDELVSYNN